MKHFRGQRGGPGGAACTLNGPLCSPRKTFRITQLPIVGQVTLLHTHTPINHTFTFNNNAVSSFIHSLLVAETYSQAGRKDSPRHKWIERLRYPHPPFSPVSSRLCEADTACPAAKTLNMPQQSDCIFNIHIQCSDSLTFYWSSQ